MPIAIKKTPTDPVRLRNLQPQMVLAAMVVEGVLAARHLSTTITSAGEYVEGRLTNSLHYEGQALDFRRTNIPDYIIDEVIADLWERLGTEYDIVLKTDHIHIEWDPKV